MSYWISAFNPGLHSAPKICQQLPSENLLSSSHHGRRAAHLPGITAISRTFAVAELDVDASDGALDALDASRSLMPRQRVTSAASRKAQLTLAFDTATKRVLPCKEDV